MNRQAKHELELSNRPTLFMGRDQRRGRGASLVGTAGVLLVALGLGACGDSSGGGPQSGTPNTPGGGGDPGDPGGEIGFPAGFDSSPAGFFFDHNESGLATELFIEEVFWGRMVDIYAPGASGVPVLRYRDFVVPETVTTKPGEYTLDQNPVTGKELLTFALNFDDPAQRQQIQDLLLVEFPKELGPVLPKGLETFELPPFPFVPRNATLVVRFNDLLDHDSISQFTVQLSAGYPPVELLEVRVLPDPNFGGAVSLEDSLEFRSSRILIDAAVSQFEAADISPPIEVNNLGMPPSVTTAQPNIAIRIPSQAVPGVGQFNILRNFKGKPVAQQGNGPVDLSVPTADVVRALRSGGEAALTGDEFNGFMRDTTAPRLVGSVAVTVGSPTPDPGSGPDHFLVDLTFAGANCAQQPDAGDVIELAGIFLEVTTQGLSPSGGVVEGLAVELIVGDSSTFFGGAALFRTPFEASADQPDCFVSFSPTPASFPGNGVAPTAEITVTFSEPMDPESIDPYDSLRIVRDNENDPLKQFIIGQITAGTELREFTFTPALPLHHDFNSSEIYNIEVVAGDNGPTDLAGNPLLDSLPLLNFSLDSQAPTSRNSGIVYRFADVDEDGDGFIDTNGQFVILPDREVIQGRPVSRFSNAVDNTNPVPSLMTPNTATTVTEPLAPLGSRLMSFWRLADMGMSLGQQDTETRLFESDSSLHNLDIERINWAPRGGQPLLENFPNFSMSLGTSTRLPDESHDPIFLTSFYGGSGLLTTGFEDNVLVDPESELRQVHDASQGYLVNPVESFGGVGNLQVMPYPMNTGSNPDLYEYFTWRDTSVQDVGGADGQGGSGADLGLALANYLAVIALPPPHPIPPPLYSGLPMHVESSADPALDPLDVAAIQAPDGINSIGLPLLMDFKCFPTGSTTLGINTFDTSLPYVQGCCVNGKASFRIHSTGGHNTAGTVISVDPALAQLPTGGFNPLSTPPGAPTPPGDDFFYSGQLDFVVRVSRAFTRFVDTSVSNFTLLDPIVLPLPQDQPTGTSISIDFRVAVDVFNSPNGNDLSVDASALDSYGDLPDEDDRALTPSDPEVITVAIAPKVAPQFKNDGVSFATPTGYQWMDDLDAINEFIGARYLQARLTFVSNPATGLSPEASSLAIPYLLP